MSLNINLTMTENVIRCEIIVIKKEEKKYINFLFLGKEVQVLKLGGEQMSDEEVRNFYFDYICVDTTGGISPYNIAQQVFNKYFELTDKSVIESEE